MSRAIRAELLKLRTIRLPWVLLAIGVGLSALVAVLTASRAGSAGGGPGFRHLVIAPLNTAAGLKAVITTTDFALLLAMVFGVIVASGEFRHGTATPTFLAVPRRSQVLLAKAVAAATFGVLFGLLAAGATTAIGLLFVSAKGYAVALSGTTMLRYVGGAALASILLALLGVAVGWLVRQQVAAVVGVLVWGFVVERILGALYSSAAPYLPYTAATTLAGHTIESGSTALPFGAAAVLVAGVAVVIALVAARSTQLRDVA
jgi:ABC-type transport system involved in multi-copper enzyme maturation permease subunit